MPFALVEAQEGTATGELLGTDLYRKAAQANDRALFSPQGAGEDERKAALEFCEYVKSKMEEIPDTKKRLRFKWVDCMY